MISCNQSRSGWNGKIKLCKWGREQGDSSPIWLAKWTRSSCPNASQLFLSSLLLAFSFDCLQWSFPFFFLFTSSLPDFHKSSSNASVRYLIIGRTCLPSSTPYLRMFVEKVGRVLYEYVSHFTSSSPYLSLDFRFILPKQPTALSL